MAEGIFDREDALNTILGYFQSESKAEEKKPLAKIVEVGDDRAQYCSHCGGLPSLHIANFKDKDAHPDNVYICCSHCGECDGKWYPDEQSALDAWNEANLGSLPRNPKDKDMYDIIKEMVENMKLPD